MHARYYDPVVGVFLSADTAQGNAQGLNPYAYVNGNPQTHSDPSGQMYIPVSGSGPSSIGPLTGGTSWTVPGIPITTTFNNGGGNPSKNDASAINSACLQVGCRSSIQLDTGSSWVPGVGSMCLLGPGSCILVPTFYRLNTPPITINYCPTGCQDGEGGEEGQSKTAEDLGGGVFASDEGGPAGENAEEPGIRVGTSNKNPAGGDTGLTFSDTTINDYYRFVKNDRPGPGMDRVTQLFTGESPRPYIQSPATNWLVSNIMEGSVSIPDAFLANGSKWVVPGFFGKTEGVWELVIDMDSGTIVHFLFKGS